MWYDVLSYIDIIGLYESNPYLWDFIIFFALFLGLSNVVFAGKFGKGGKWEKKQAKVMATAVAFALALTLVLFMWRAGWYLGRAELALPALIIIWAVLMLLFTTVFHEYLGMDKVCASAAAFVLTYPSVVALFDDPFQSLYNYSPSGSLLAAIFSIAYIIAIVKLILCAVSLFKSDDPDKDDPDDTVENVKWNDKKKEKQKKNKKIRVKIIAPKNRSTFKAPADVELVCQVDGSSGTASIQYFLNNSPVVNKSKIQPPTTEAHKFGKLNNKGRYNLKVEVIDLESGHRHEDDIDIGVLAGSGDSQFSISIDKPDKDNLKYSRSKPIDFQATIANGSGNYKVDSAIIDSSRNKIHEQSAPSGETMNSQWDPSKNPAGSYTAVIRATDNDDSSKVAVAQRKFETVNDSSTSDLDLRIIDPAPQSSFYVGKPVLVRVNVGGSNGKYTTVVHVRGPDGNDVRREVYQRNGEVGFKLDTSSLRAGSYEVMVAAQRGKEGIVKASRPFVLLPVKPTKPNLNVRFRQ